MKAVKKELVIGANELPLNSDNTAYADYKANVQTDKSNAESSDDNDLFDNLRKMRDNNESITINQFANKSLSKSATDQSVSFNAPRNNKRSRSVDSDDGNSRDKMQRIDETDENGADDDDILSFAKKTLQQTDLPDTEDILSHIPIDDSSGE